MALSWNLEKIADWKEVSEGEAWAVTDMLIWCTLFTGIGQVTEQTAPEFYARIHWLETKEGAFLNGTDPETGERKGRPITIEDVIRRIGLETNATYKTETRASWIKRTTKNDLDTAVREFKAALAKEKVA